LNKLFLIIGAFVAGVILLWILLAAVIMASSGPSPFFGGSIAVIPIKGTIVSSEDGFGGQASAEEIIYQLEQADEDSLVEAILLDIDSPGGSVVPTKQIVYEIREIEKPVVSYIGETGASGAYYIAAASDYIVADEDSFTGSIGVFSMVMNIEGLMEMLGIDVNVITAGERKGTGSLFTEFTEEDKILYEILLNETFDNFKEDILAFRGDRITAPELDAVADGRIVSGRQALEAKLIDSTGTKKEAIQITADLAGITDEPNLISYEKSDFTFLDLFLSMGYNFGAGLKASLTENPRGIMS